MGGVRPLTPCFPVVEGPRSVAPLGGPAFISGMHCDTCDRDSSNRRVCPYCFTPYPTDESGEKNASKRASPPPIVTPRPPANSGTANDSLAANARERFMRQTPIVRWSAVGIFLVFAFWVFSGGDEAATAAGSAAGSAAGGTTSAAAPALPPMTVDQARAHIAQTRGTALVETNGDEVFVSFTAAAFPLRDDGQRALVERFSQADELVEGRKRRISFYNPNGRLFAQTDGAGNLILK